MHIRGSYFFIRICQIVDRCTALSELYDFPSLHLGSRGAQSLHRLKSRLDATGADHELSLTIIRTGPNSNVRSASTLFMALLRSLKIASRSFSKANSRS